MLLLESTLVEAPNNFDQFADFRPNWWVLLIDNVR